MAVYRMFSDDTPVARFSFDAGRVTSFTPESPELLPMQIRAATADGFASWMKTVKTYTGWLKPSKSAHT